MTSLYIKNLTISKNNHILIHDFSHQFEAGKIYALIGDNGSGKTTLLKTLAGLYPVKDGHILIENKNISMLSQKIRAMLISFLLQQSPDQPYCLTRSRIAHGLMPMLGYDFFLDANAQQMIEAMAKRLHISHLLNRVLSHLSGGEQRLVHIAKCLINPSAKVLLLDEPSVFLDFSQQLNLTKNLQEQAQGGRLIIFSSHDKNFIEKIAHGIIEIKDRHAKYQHKLGVRN